MKEATVNPDLKVDIIDSPIPKPNDDQLVIKVVFSGSNPKDWKIPEWLGTTGNTGDDIAGIVHEVGSNVVEFKPGDRVAAFHEMTLPGGSYAEYAVAWSHTTFHLPKSTSFEEAATIPLAAMTAALGLYKRLKLPQPWAPATTKIPLIVYGAASAVGAYGIKLAVQSNIHPILAIAGRGADFVKSIPGFDPAKGDAIIDYREGDDKVVEGLQAALKKAGVEKVEHALDAVSEKGSYQNICKVLDAHGAITLVLPGKEYPEIPKTVRQSKTTVGSVHGGQGYEDGDKDLGFVFFRYFGRGLGNGSFSGHPYEVRKGGLGGIEGALKDLRDGKASAVKYIFRIADTEGAEQ